jgi:nucleoside 2-deoxyribosyltransferase
MNKLCYLAGAITCHDRNNLIGKATHWREIATHLLKNEKIETFNPMCNYYINKEFDSKGVVLQNLLYLQKSDLILVDLECIEISPGTLWEIYLSWYMKKPVIAFGKLNTDIINQPHVNAAINMRFEFLDEACDYIRSMYHS